MKQRMLSKTLVVAVILFLLSISVTPSFGMSNNDDTTPPVTTINFYGMQGENGWYIRWVLINLTATDDLSGVNTTFYRINGGDWEIYIKHFGIDYDGIHIIEFYSVDNAGNTEEVKSAELKIDQRGPIIDVVYERKGLKKWKFIATCFDDMSGMDRVEFYCDDELMFTDYEKPYEWIWNDSELPDNFSIFAWDNAGNGGSPLSSTPYNIIGIILNPQFSEYSVSFFAVILLDDVRGDCEIIKFEKYTLNTIGCTGHIGKFFIFANYRYKWLPD